MNTSIKFSLLLSILLAPAVAQASFLKPAIILKGAVAVSFVVYNVVQYHAAEHKKVDDQISLLQTRIAQIQRATDLRSVNEKALLELEIVRLRALQEYHS